MNVIRVKPGVKFDRIAPAGFRILEALGVVARLVNHDLEITCGTEGHNATDPHTLGEAYDVSVIDLDLKTVLLARSGLQTQLGGLFTVLYECPTQPKDPRLMAIAYVNPPATAPHFHVQRRNTAVFPPPAAPAPVQA